jgi:hypothetical protein
LGGSQFEASPGKKVWGGEAGGVTQGIGPEFKLQPRKKKKKKNLKQITHTKGRDIYGRGCK